MGDLWNYLEIELFPADKASFAAKIRVRIIDIPQWIC